MSDTKLVELKDETKKDNQLQQLTNMIKTGWPTTKQIHLKNVHHFGTSEMNFVYLTTSFSKVKKWLSQGKCSLKCYAIFTVHTSALKNANSEPGMFFFGQE